MYKEEFSATHVLPALAEFTRHINGVQASDLDALRTLFLHGLRVHYTQEETGALLVLKDLLRLLEALSEQTDKNGQYAEWHDTLLAIKGDVAHPEPTEAERDGETLPYRAASDFVDITETVRLRIEEMFFEVYEPPLNTKN